MIMSDYFLLTNGMKICVALTMVVRVAIAIFSRLPREVIEITTRSADPGDKPAGICTDTSMLTWLFELNGPTTEGTIVGQTLPVMVRSNVSVIAPEFSTWNIKGAAIPGEPDWVAEVGVTFIE